MLPTLPPDLSASSPLRWRGWGVALPVALAALAGVATFWLAPPLVERDVLAWAAAMAAGLAVGGVLLAVAARGDLAHHDRLRRREQAVAAWRDDASLDGFPDEDDGEDGAGGPADPGFSLADARALLDALGDAAVLLDRDGWIVAANTAAGAALGAAAAPESRWDERTVWPSPLTPERRALPGGAALLLGRDPLHDRLRAAQIDGMDAMASLAGGLVHDVNNALGAVAGYADFLVADLPADSPQADYAARILRAVDRSKTMLRRLLVACRNAPPDFRPVRADRILADTAALLRSSLPDGVGLTVHDAPDLPVFPGHAPLLARTLAALGPEILGAADARLAVRASLWSGAMDAVVAPPGWRVLVPLSPRRRPHAVLELRSSGAPRSVAELRALLDPLHAAREAARRQTEETPPAALAVARWHDGGLVVWTHPVEGTLVRLFLPLNGAGDVGGVAGALPVPPGAAAPGAPSGAPSRTPSRHVLVVDDDPAMGDWLSVTLERMGCEVAVCESAAEALEIMVEEPASFDIVIAGPLAAGMSGPALIVRLKALRPGLFCVLCGDLDGGPGAQPVPADLFLPRPVDAASLARAVATFTPMGGRSP